MTDKPEAAKVSAPPATAPKAKPQSAARRREDSGALDSPSLDCRPDVCELGDQTSKWKDYQNYECPKCGYATIDEAELNKRRPGFARR